MEDLGGQEGHFDDQGQINAAKLQNIKEGKIQDVSKLDEDETMAHSNAGKLQEDAVKPEASAVMEDDAAASGIAAKMCDDSEEASNAGMYRYIKDDLFTSEIFKVEIQNLPKYIGFNDVKKFLAKYGLNPHKIKLMQKQTFAFVTFKSEEERNKAMKVIHGVMWKNRLLTVRLAKPKADPIMKKRKQDDDEKEQSLSKRKVAEENTPEESLSKQIADVVTPLWQIPYEEQLKMKEQECEHVLQRLTKEIGNNNKALLPWLFVQKQKYNKVCCPLEGVRPSPVQTEYRNKCEFLIGAGANNEDKTVGFRLGKYKGGTCAVVEPFDTVHIPCITKKVVKAFQEYIRASPYVVYSPESYGGHWKQLTVRSSRKGHVMAIVYFHPQKLSKEDLMELKSSLAKFFSDGPGKDSGVTSLYFVEEGQRKSPNLEDLPVEHVTGEQYIFEELLGLTFRISPHSFFQVNTLAAEVLYSAIADWAQLDQNSTVLDVCCGTGTIGISLAKKVKKVVGIELCQEAISDAKANAKLNDLNNIEFRCGKAEDIFPTLINSYTAQSPVAIVDPPRAGLHSKVVIAIRKAEHIKRLIYVSCNPKAALNNFVDLCRAPSNRVKGRPFRPIRAMAVDLFPQTPHCELLILFERVEYTESASTIAPEMNREQKVENQQDGDGEKERCADPEMSSSHNFTTSFIELYRARPCLWQVKSKAYRDHKLKTQAYEELVALAKPHFPGIKCDIDFVKTEIKSMRTVFKKEWEKVRNTTRSGASSSDIYKPKLWYYDLLTFTVDQNELRPMQAPEEEDANLAEAPGTSQGLENTPEDDDAVAGPSHMSPRIEGEPSQGEATDGESYPRVAPTRPAKRSHKSHNTTSDDILEVATSFLTSRMEPCPAMCHLLRQRQHKISDDQMRHLDRVIHQVIDAAQMGELGEESQWPRASPAPPAETPRLAPIRRQRRGPKSRDTRTKPRS